MSLKKSVCFVSIGMAVGALAYGCSSSSSNTGTGDDAGSADGSVHDSPIGTDSAADGAKVDASKDGQALTCAPIDVSMFMPPAFAPVHRQVGACTDQNIA